MKIETRKVMSPKGDITLYKLTNASGASVELSSLGAGIVSVVVPDSKGEMADVTLGYKNPADYIADGPCAGKIPGRYANRIAGAKFTLDGVEYNLDTDRENYALHGGPEGFQNQIWDSEAKGSQVKFTYVSADGEAGYPGKLTATALYTWSDDNVLTIDLAAVTDKKTVVNLTNHAYFNLDGENAGSVLDHQLELNASQFLETDSSLVPTGKLLDVEGTPMDFRKPMALRDGIDADYPAIKAGKGYDSCWVLSDWRKHELNPAARLTSPKSGRVLEVFTTQPGVQVYAGCWLDGSPVNKSGRPYNDYDGVAIECQGYPDAPNQPTFPSQILAPGEQYHQTIVFKFSNK